MNRHFNKLTIKITPSASLEGFMDLDIRVRQNFNEHVFNETLYYDDFISVWDRIWDRAKMQLGNEINKVYALKLEDEQNGQ